MTPRFRRRLLFLGVLSLILLVPPALPQTGAAESPITVISSDDNHLTLEILSPPFRMEGFEETDGTYQKILIDGWPLSPEAGYPALPRTGMLIPVTTEGTMRLEIVPGTAQSYCNCRVWPLPERVRSPQGEPGEHFVKNETIYGKSGFYPALDSLVQLGPREYIGNRQVARLTVTPFQWNPATGELRHYPRIGCTVHFDTTAPEVPSDMAVKGIAGKNDDIGSPSGTAVKTTTLSAPWSREGVKMTVMQDGLYRLTYEDLAAAGMDETLIGTGAFRLFRGGGECARKIVSAGKGFAPGDYVEFYGEGLNTQFTDANVYWLIHDTPGVSVTTLDGRVTGGKIAVDSFTDTLHVEENHVIWTRTPGAPDEDYWFWEKLTASSTKPDSVTHNVTIPAPKAEENDATVRVSFQGGSDMSENPDHHVRVSLNGWEIGEAYWDGTATAVLEALIPSSRLREGANTLTIEVPGDTGSSVDIVYFNGLDIVYGRALEADNDTLTFTVESACEPTVTGLSGTDVIIYDITDPSAVKEVTGFTVSGGGGSFSVTFTSVLDGPRTYHITRVDNIRVPEQMTYREPANLVSPENGADYILITAEAFLPAVESLCHLRRLQGLRVAAVSVEDILNEFNGGIFDPGALKAFLTCAFENWQKPAPRSVFLVGDATLDYRDYYGTGKENRVPLYLTVTGTLGLTPSDNWYACVKGDDMLPDLSLGRIPGAGVEEVTRTIGKIITYETSPDYGPKEVLLVADDDYADFEEINDDLASELPEDIAVTRVYAGRYGAISDATDDIIDALNGGTLLTNYFGHGDLTCWGSSPDMTGDFIFESYDLNRLANAGRLTFVVALDCLNGYFGQPFIYSLGEEFLGASEKGAVASFAPSALGYIWEQKIVDEELFSLIFEDEENRLGTLTTESKIAAYGRGASEDIVDMFHLFGDPETRLAIYDRGPAAETFTITARRGSHGTIIPSGTITVVAGAGQTFAIAPDKTYEIDDVIVDGTSIGPVDFYRFENIQSDHTIEATFAEESADGSGGGESGGGGGCFIDSLSP